jgi:hypothetical protein
MAELDKIKNNKNIVNRDSLLEVDVQNKCK